MFLWKTNSSLGPCILQNWAMVSLTNTLQKFNPFQTLALLDYAIKAFPAISSEIQVLKN